MDGLAVGDVIMRGVRLLCSTAAKLPIQADANQASGFPWSNLITAVASVAAGLGTLMLTQRYAQRRDREASRREAYEAFILALDGLDRIWAPLLRAEREFDQQSVGSATNQATDQIQGAYVTVLLVGTTKAKQNANAARQAAWKLSDRSQVPSGQQAFVVPGFEQLKPLACDFRKGRRTFIDAVEREFE
jgi:hypothetical protein